MRVVLDTNILVSACLTPEGSSARIVELALLGRFTLYLTAEIVVEYNDVLVRQKFFQQRDRIAILLKGVVDVAENVSPEKRLSVSPDEEDNRMLECAQAAQADFLVTGNSKHFPASLGLTRIVNPRDFLIEVATEL